MLCIPNFKFSLTECKIEPDGTDYGGKALQTISGLTCQAWTQQFPHTNPYNVSDLFNDDWHHNYCRNPRVSPNGR